MTKKFSILIVEDEKDIRRGIVELLRNANYSILEAPNARKGIELATSNTPELVILDLKLPDMDGLDVCRELKKEPKTAGIPILMLTSRSSDVDKILGFEVGSDDYLTKPFNDLELLARVKAILKRVYQWDMGERPKIIQADAISVNFDSRRVTVGSKEIQLTRKEFDLLALFLSKPGKVLSRSHLIAQIWGDDFDSLQGTVDNHITNLRKKLGSYGKSLETIHGVGYRWDGEE